MERRAGDVRAASIAGSSVIHRAVPEIRIRKGSDAPSIGEIKGTAPLASIESEGLSEGTSDVDDLDTETLKDNTDLFTDTDSSTVFFSAVESSSNIPNANLAHWECGKNTVLYGELDNNDDDYSLDALSGNSTTEDLSMDNVIIGENDNREDGDITPCASPPPPPEDNYENVKEDQIMDNPMDLSSWPAPPSKSPSLDRKDFTPDSGLDDNFDTEDSERPGGTHAFEEQEEDVEEGEAEEEVDQEPEDTVTYEPLDNEEGGDDPFDLSYIEKKYSKEILETSEDSPPVKTSPINLDSLDDFLADTTSNTTQDNTTALNTSIEKSPEKITISIPNFKKRPKSPSRESKGNDALNGDTSNDKGDGLPKAIKGPPRRPPPPSNTSKPGRPPPPNSRPPPPKQGKQKEWETFEIGSTPSPKRPPPPKILPKRGEGESPRVSKETHDDEAAILDSGEVKKAKSKGIKAPKALKNIVGGGKSKDKKEKKEKLRQHQRELMSKFTSDQDDTKEADKQNSEEWKKYQELLGKSENDVQDTKEKLSKMEAGFKPEIDKLWGISTSSNPSGSPWAGDSTDSGHPFDAPLDEKNPPKVGWVGFDDDFHEKSSPDQTKGVSSQEDSHDLVGLGIVSEDKPAGGESTATDVDILGLGNDSEFVETQQGTTKTTADVNEFGALYMSDNIVASDTANETSNVAVELVDDFLGITFGEKPKPIKDPLDMLKSEDNNQDTTTKVANDLDDFLGLCEKSTNVNDSLTSAENGDAFGLGSGPQSTTKVTVTLNGDLFDVDEDINNVAVDPFTVDMDKITKESEASVKDESENLESIETVDAEQVQSPVSDDFDPRAEISEEQIQAKPVTDTAPQDWSTPKNTVRARPRPKSSTKSDNPFKDTSSDAGAISGIVLAKPTSKSPEPPAQSATPNPFADIVDAIEVKAEDTMDNQEASAEASGVDSLLDFLGGGEQTGTPAQETKELQKEQNADSAFDIFETITDEENGHSLEEDIFKGEDDSFDPFETIHGDIEPAKDEGGFDIFQSIQGEDAFVAHFPESDLGASPDREVSPGRINPFNKEPPLDEKFAKFESQTTKAAAATTKVPQKSVESPKMTSESSFTEEEEEELEPLPSFHQPFEGEGWNLYLRLPTGKKKITQNRYWKPVFVRLVIHKDAPTLRIYNNDKTQEVMQELVLQPQYNICDMGLQQYDQFGKCHTVKIQNILYRETLGVKAERIAPTFGDIARVRDLKSLKDLVHKPKTTMILDHAPQTQELFKFGSVSHQDITTFIRELEDTFFHLKVAREASATYTKDEITVDIVDEYHLDLDKYFHIIDHKARVRMFAISFLSGLPIVEVGVNDKKRRGKEVVGRHDIIPIKTEEWIRMEQPEFNSNVDMEEYEKARILKFKPLDATRFELLRFRVRPVQNKELPLQLKVEQSLIDRHFEIKAEVIIPGFHSNSRKASQTPCEDIQIRFPIPEPWIYYFRVEKHFRYGSLHSTLRKPGKIKGFERLTMIAKGMLPPSLIEVSAGQAKYEHLFKAIVWRVARLPERNEGAYKTHLLTLRLDLGPHDPIPDTFAQHCHVEFSMPNSTVSRAQVRSISISNPAETPPDRWVHHLAKYQYRVEMEYTDQPKKSVWEETEAEGSGLTSPGSPAGGGSGGAPMAESEHSRDGDREDSDSDDTDSD